MNAIKNYSAIALLVVLCAITGNRGLAADEKLPVIEGKEAVATVNDDPISLEELNRAIAAAHTNRTGGKNPVYRSG